MSAWFDSLSMVDGRPVGRSYATPSTHTQGDTPQLNFDPSHKKFVLATRGNTVPRDCQLNITESDSTVTSISILFAQESSAGASALYIVVGQ